MLLEGGCRLILPADALDPCGFDVPLGASTPAREPRRPSSLGSPGHRGGAAFPRPLHSTGPVPLAGRRDREAVLEWQTVAPRMRSEDALPKPMHGGAPRRRIRTACADPV